MTISKMLVLACACACVGSAMAQETAQVQPLALSARPKVLTRPNPFDGGAAVVASGTGFLLGWNSGPDLNGTGVFARQFSNKGVGLKPVATLRKKTQNLVGHPKFADVRGGKFAVVWQGVQQQFPGGPIIEGGIFNTATNKIGRIVQIATTDSSVHDIVRITTGNLALVTQQQNPNPGPALDQVVVFILNPKTLEIIKGPVPVNGNGDQISSQGAILDHTIVARQSGGYAIFLNRDAQPDPVLMMRGFNQDAVLDLNVIQVNTTPILGFGTVQAARLTNNNIIVVWAQGAPDGNGGEIRARLFTNDGVPLGADFHVNTVVTNDQYFPKAIALDRGAFAITWLSEEASAPPASQRRHYLRIYKANGRPAGRPIRTQSVKFPPAVNIDNAVTRLSDTSLVDVYSDIDSRNDRILGDGIPAAQAQP